MKKLVTWLLFIASLALGQAARAQYYGGHHCCCCCHSRDTTTLTERTNRVVWLIGPTLLASADGRARGGGFMELGAAVGPRLTVTGHLMLSANRASADNFGTEATAPAYGLHALTGRARYQLLNAHRWRVETLVGLGLGAVQVVDRDQQVYYSTSRGSGTYAATVAFRVQPLAEAGLSASWKVAREFWLTSQATYAQPALSGGLGAASNFSYWNASVGATIPWGYLGHRR